MEYHIFLIHQILSFYDFGDLGPLRYKLSYWQSFNNYVDRKGYVGGHSNVYIYKVNDHFLFTSLVYEGWVVKSVQKSVYKVIG